jgi:sugar/nucleoside kinase (ribokinase family)
VILPVAEEDRRYIHTFGANAALTAADLPESSGVIYVGGYLILPALDEVELAAGLARARARGAVVILDVVAPSGARPSIETLRPLLEQTDYFVPNHDEARAITGEDDPRQQARLLAELGAGTVMIKLGERGLHVLAGSESFDLGAATVEAVDPSGAGDAFAAGLALGILEEWPVERTAQFASVLGASACTALGCADGVFTREQAEAFLREHPLPVTGR